MGTAVHELVAALPTDTGRAAFTPGRTPNEGDLLDILAVIAPDHAIRERILVDNPARLYGFERTAP